MENSELCRENSGKNSKTCGKITKCMIYCKHFHKQNESIITHVNFTWAKRLKKERRKGGT